MRKQTHAILVLLVLLAGLAHGHQVRPLSDMRSIEAALRMFEIRAGRLPTQDEGLEALIERPRTYPMGKPWIRLMDEPPMDPWGRPYGYVRSDALDDGFGLFSKGPDGVSRLAGEDPDDWNSWSDDQRGKRTFVDHLQRLPKLLFVALGLLTLAIGYLVRSRLVTRETNPERAAVGKPTTRPEPGFHND